jgi:sucrose phosphorylase
MEVLVEIHSHYLAQMQIARQVDWVYDFALPPLVLHSLFVRDARALGRWLAVRPRNCITVLDTHDGIGVIDVGPGPEEVAGLLTQSEIDGLVETIHTRSSGQSRMASGAAANNLDSYQVNCTYYDAVGRRDNEYLIARAIQFFVPGIPQVYYVGLLAGTNDMDLLGRSGVGRDINRHYYTADGVEESLRYPVVQRLIELIRLRNAHPAFAGQAYVELPNNQRLVIAWENGDHWAKLEVDFKRLAALVTHSKISSDEELSVGSWDSQITVPSSEGLR